MGTRIPASMRTREALSALIEGRLASPAGRSELVELATRLIVEEALEGEVRDALDRGYYERGDAPGQGHRNGHRTHRLKSAEGGLEYSAPQVAGLAQPFRSALRDHLKGHTEALESLAVEMLARGLSVRDIEDAFKDETGRLLLSKTAVSEIGKQLWEDYQAFKSRDLAEYDIAYLFIDGIAERIRPGQRREPVLAAWGFTFDGRKVLLHLMAGSKEDAETVLAFFQDMRARGLGEPLLVVSDGASGIIKARGLLRALDPPALPGASDAQPRRQGAGGSLARVQGEGHRRLSGPEPQNRPRARRRCRRRLRQRARQRGRLLHGRLRSLHRPSPAADHPPPGDADHG